MKHVIGKFLMKQPCWRLLPVIDGVLLIGIFVDFLDSGAGVENASSVASGGREHINSPTYVKSENTSDASQPTSPHDRHPSNSHPGSTPDYLSRGGGFGRGRGTSVSPEIEMGYSGEEKRPGQYERPLMSVEHCWDDSTPSASSRSSHTHSTSQSSGSSRSTSVLSSSASPRTATSATASTDHSGIQQKL